MKPSITFNTQDYPVEWVIFPTIILNTEGRFHRTTIDKIWVEKEDMPTTK